MATTWTNETPNSTGFTAQTRSDSGTTITAGESMGLLLTLTYASEIAGASTTWTNESLSDS